MIEKLINDYNLETQSHSLYFNYVCSNM